MLPSGRLVTPAGTSLITGTNAASFGLTPDGRYAIVASAGTVSAGARSSLDPNAFDGPALSVVDTAGFTVVSRYRPPFGESYFGAVVATADPLQPQRTLVLVTGGGTDAVYAFTLGPSGVLAPDARHVIRLPGALDRGFADAGQSVPVGLTLSADGRRAYAVEAAGGSVATIDLASRSPIGPPRAVGFFPHAAVLAGNRLVVTNEGLMRYGRLAAPLTEPLFGTPPAALDRASSLSLVDLTPAGGLAAAPPPTAGPAWVPMDPPADGLRVVGGAHPSAIVGTSDGRYAFVAMTNVDRIATVALDAPAHVVGGTELRLFDRGPYGTQPVALALSRDGSRLYVALRGLNAVAVIDARDPTHLHRLGLLPTGSAPSALALAQDDRTLYVVNAAGAGHDGAATWSTLQKIDLAAVALTDSTRASLAATRVVLPVAPSYPKTLKNVVVVAVDHLSFDAVFGDLGAPRGERAFLRAPATSTPNLHALAERYALAANAFADADGAGLGHAVLAGGEVTAFAAQAPSVGSPLFAALDDPEDAPRTGTIFTELARRNMPFRDYGGFVGVTGSDAGGYVDDVPAAAALAGHLAPGYPTADPLLPDTQRAAAFVRDYDATIASGVLPRLTYVWLPGAQLAATDAAIGAIVEHLSRLPAWRSTAVVVVSCDTQGSLDHIDAARAFVLVIGPTAKRRYVGMHHVSTASVLKLLDGVYGTPPLSLGDLLAADMSDFFTSVPDARPYVALPPPP